MVNQDITHGSRPPAQGPGHAPHVKQGTLPWAAKARQINTRARLEALWGRVISLAGALAMIHYPGPGDRRTGWRPTSVCGRVGRIAPQTCWEVGETCFHKYIEVCLPTCHALYGHVLNL